MQLYALTLQVCLPFFDFGRAEPIGLNSNLWFPLKFEMFCDSARVVYAVGRARTIQWHPTTGNLLRSRCANFWIFFIQIPGTSTLELLRLDPNTGRVTTLVSHETFGTIRALSAFRLTGSTKGESIDWLIIDWLDILTDYMVLGSDAGRIVVLEYDPINNILSRVHQVCWGLNIWPSVFHADM